MAVYSIRARPAPSVSTPVTGDELDDALASGDAARLRFHPDDLLERVRRHGDLPAPVEELVQELPRLDSSA